MSNFFCYLQFEEAKYNLKIAKEIAHLSKSLYIQTDEGKVIDEEVRSKIDKLKNSLIVELKKNTKQ